MSRRQLLGLLALSAPALALTSGTPAGAGTRSGGPVPFRPGRAMLGSYLSLHGRTPAQSLALRERQLGRGQRIVHRYHPWSGYYPSGSEVPAGSTLMVSWNGIAYRHINDGSSDRTVAAMARALAALRRPVLLRWGWEMNGNWFAWDGSHNGKNPAGFITAWRRMHRIFRAEGATDVAWVWGPNWNSGPDVGWNHFPHYYPGDAYVDWVGVSGYDFGRETPRTLFTPIVKAYGGRKPIMLAETAAVGHGPHTKARWIRQLSAYVADTPSIGAVVWFDTDTQKGVRHNFRPDTDAETLAAYRAMARSRRFSG
jgi:hypothetical protein